MCLVFVRNLRVENPGKKQQVLELAVGGLYHIFDDILGEKGRRYIPFLMSILVYLGISNMIGIFGLKPPTKDLNVTAALAILSIILIEYSGFYAKGGRGFIRSFAQPMAIMTPINILEVFIRPLSLCMRLFGNVLGSYVVMKLVEIICPILLPVPFNLYFDFFDGFIQAYVFVFLTSLFISEAVE